MFGGIVPQRKITRADPAWLSRSTGLLPGEFDSPPHFQHRLRLAAAGGHVAVAPLGDAIHNRRHITADEHFGSARPRRRRTDGTYVIRQRFTAPQAPQHRQLFFGSLAASMK